MIEISKLNFRYGSQEVLSNISLNLEPGHIYGLLGENGVGKTTLLSLLCGLKKCKSGTIRVDGTDPYTRHPELLEKQFFLCDTPEPLREKAGKFAKARGAFWPAYDHEKFLKIMAEFETPADKRMDQMSAGQLKKTYISFALACNAKFIYMDEPTNGLDIPSKSQFRKAIMAYTSEDSVIIISTHQVRDLENVLDQTIILDTREVLLNATPEEITSKLFFDYGNIARPDALYSEAIPGGFIQVCPNKDGAESKLNLEALFNAAHYNKQAFKTIFNYE